MEVNVFKDDDELGSTQQFNLLTEKMEGNSKFQKKRLSKRIWFILFLIIQAVSLFILGVEFSGYFNSDTQIGKIEYISDLLAENWYYNNQFEDIEKDLLDNALKGLANFEIDPYTTYLTSDELIDFQDSTNHEFVGIGVQILNINDNTIVKMPFEGSPASLSGILAGDIIISVDGNNVVGKDSDYVQSLVLGEIGSSVNVEVLRDNKTLSFDVIRDNIRSVFYTIIDNIGYIEILSFGNNTGIDLRNTISSLLDLGINDYIIDLRGNSGGYLDSLVDIGSIFVPKDSIIIKEVNNNNEVINVYRTKEEPLVGINKIVLLIDYDSASASEALVLSLQDYIDNIYTIGTNSYGKGTIQQTLLLADNSGIKFTTGRWESGLGNYLTDEGITPDLYIDYPLAIIDNLILVDDFLPIEFLDYNIVIEYIQELLLYIGYDIDKVDGIYDQDTLDIINLYQSDYGYPISDKITKEFYMSIVSKVYNKFYVGISNDVHVQEALKYIK